MQTINPIRIGENDTKRLLTLECAEQPSPEQNLIPLAVRAMRTPVRCQGIPSSLRKIATIPGIGEEEEKLGQSHFPCENAKW